MTRLGVNIDHIATIRNARGSTHPDPLLAAKRAISSGANSVTIHLREDRRHIRDNDVFKICKEKKLQVNLEVSLNSKILRIALKNQPNFICLVPENRKEITTEGGLNLSKNKNRIKRIISQFKKKNIRTSLFINPTIKDIKLAKKLGTDCIELHTGKISNLVKANKSFYRELVMIKKCCKLASLIGLEVHAGHGLDYKTTKILKKIKQIEEFNIGHFIIGESVFYGLDKTIKTFKKIIK